MPHDDYDALIFLYDALKGIKWTNSTNWDDPDVPLSKWHGIKVNICGRIEEICLKDNKLIGELPESDRWCALTNHLKRLYLSNNSLIKSIPKAIGSLTNLEELNLSWNKLTGTIPEGIYDIKTLKIIRLDNNRLSGPISEDINKLTSLEYIDCSRNLLSGLIPYCLIQHMKQQDKPARSVYAHVEDANIDIQYAVVYKRYEQAYGVQQLEIEALQNKAERLEAQLQKQKDKAKRIKDRKLNRDGDGDGDGKEDDFEDDDDSVEGSDDGDGSDTGSNTGSGGVDLD